MTEYKKPNFTVDSVVLGYDHQLQELRVLLIQRGKEPFEGMFSLAGGFVNENEDIYDASRRELKEETNISLERNALLPLTIKYEEGRDPRGWTITQPFMSFVILEGTAVVTNLYPIQYESTKAGDDAKGFKWVNFNRERPELAFDHSNTIAEAFIKLVDIIDNQPLNGFLPSILNLDDLRIIREQVCSIAQGESDETA